MKPIDVKAFFVLLFITAVMTVSPPWADARDTLPLGPSEYKYIIDKIEQDQIIETASGNVITLEDIIARTGNTDVYIIGEAHDNYQCHTFQRDFIEALYKKHPKLIVGFEFFWREDNELLEQWRTKQLTEKELIEKVGWYKRGGQNFAYTRLIMEIIQKYKIKTIGLNVPRSILRSVSRKGFDQLSEEEKKLFPTIGIANPEHEFLIKSIFGTFAAQVPMWFNNIYAAQKCWDVIMAESMRQTLAKEEYKGYKGVIIAGSNHVVYKLGIPFRYEKADSSAKITTIVPILLPEEKEEDGDEDEDMHPMMKAMGKSLKPASIFSRGIADYVFSAQHPKYHVFPVIGLVIAKKNDKLVVTRVSKKSIAEKNGISKDDEITSVDGVPVTEVEQFRTIATSKNWDDSISIGVVKHIGLKKEDKEEKQEKKE